MLLCAEKFRDHLVKSELKYKILRDTDEIVLFALPHKGRNYACLFSGKDGESFTVNVLWCSVPEERLVKAYICANEINAKYKWVRLYIDEENNLVASSDIVLAPSTVAEYASELLVDRLIGILEKNDELIEKAING